MDGTLLCVILYLIGIFFAGFIILIIWTEIETLKFFSKVKSVSFSLALLVTFHNQKVTT